MPATDRLTRFYAVAAAGLTVAFQLAGKATRDALFLSTFGVSALPRMVIISAVVSVVLTLGLTRVMARTGPGRLVPRLFWLSSVLLLIEWALIEPSRPAAAVLFYLHFGGGALLVSGFWALVNERFDPRSARGAIGRITTGASLGGLLGGILPERIGATLSLPAMLPILAGFHLLAGLLVLWLRRATKPQEPSARRDGADARSPRQVFLSSPYLQGIALLVVLISTAEGLLDYVFKAGATMTASNDTQLLRLFAAFYTGTAVLTILLQVALLKPLLNHFGIAKSAALLPGGASLGAMGAILLPGFGPVLAARAIEVVLHNSIFRAAYELLFTPVSPREKRATKLLLDVGLARVGDVVAGALVQAALIVGLATAAPLLWAGLFVSGMALLAARQLHIGYVGALEQTLHRRAGDLPALPQDPNQTLLQSFGAFDLSTLRERVSQPELVVTPDNTDPVPATPPPRPAAAALAVPGSALPVPRSPRVGPVPVPTPVSPAEIDHTVSLLAWDDAAPQARQALVPIARSNPERLIQHLLDPEEDFAVRRRLVRVLADAPGEAAFEGLMRALEDQRFEVRYRAGRGLARMLLQNSILPVDRDRVVDTVLREVAVERGLWEGRQLIDQVDDDTSPMEVGVLRDRANRSLEHVFTLLSLILPQETLRLAFHGLHAPDAHLRGTALEYLESILPERVREKLWPFLEVRERPSQRDLTPEQALQQLLASRESIVLALAQAREKQGVSDPQRGTGN